MLPYQQAQQGLVKNSSLWGGKIGGRKPGWTSLQPPPPPPRHFDPSPNSREQELSRYSHLSDSIHWASLDIIKMMRPETQAHDLRDMLLLKSMYFRFFSVYSIGIPLFLENKSYPGIPTGPHAAERVLPYQQAQQGLVRNSSLWGGKIGGQKPVWTSLHPPPILTPPILENKG